jgi:hypothetical protein|tara:strand:+ start:406 stop:708 length:303 start_codon:yes stop_codon:yes gene_type:complete
MPYKSTDAAVQSSEYYGVYRQREINRKRQEILKNRTDYLSNPKFATSLTRDKNGVLLSFENPIAFGKADEELYELVTLETKQRLFKQKFIEKINTTFNFF